MPIRILALCVFFLPALAFGDGRRCGDDVDGRPVPCACGDVLVSARHLTATDPLTRETCRGHGLRVEVEPGVDAPRLDLGGYTIRGRGRGVGILVTRGGASGLVLTGPGGVEGFDVGIAGGAIQRVTDVASRSNRNDGFRLGGTGYRIEGARATDNGHHGFVLRGDGFAVDGCEATANRGSGFAVEGRGGTLGAAAPNTATANGRDGFQLRGSGHRLSDAEAVDNRGHGVATREDSAALVDVAATGNRLGDQPRPRERRGRRPPRSDRRLGGAR